jgi:hypothetical protein
VVGVVVAAVVVGLASGRFECCVVVGVEFVLVEVKDKSMLAIAPDNRPRA